MTREEFESILEEAFLEGYNDAMEEIFDEDNKYSIKDEIKKYSPEYEIKKYTPEYQTEKYSPSKKGKRSILDFIKTFKNR